MSKAKQFFEDTLFDISLESLYQLHSASNFSTDDKFCAVVLKLGDEMLQKVSENYKYLLIVYKRDGK